MRSFGIFGSVVALALSLGVSADSHIGRRHDGIARRVRGDLVEKRSYDNARFTFYDVGLGSCGQYNVPSDFIVALDTSLYGGGYPGPNCFKSITISWGGKTAQATIMDECPGCPYGGLDFSRGLFDYFAPESVGVLYGTWWYNDGSGGGGNTQPTTTSWKPEPTTTWTPPPPPPTTKETPTTTWTPPPTTTWTPPPPSTSSAPPSSSPPASSATPSSSSEKKSSTATSSSAAATPSASSGPQNIDGMNLAVGGLGGIILAGASS
ncbi:hypothetical protein JAAARDRAFT_32987 [Jaapia argillacea MUCL 33604]|uniref:RlpA-like protein double-psi beta-barrel domain-containing protein n=1 Tax=Jaapia argillacea MUCL 33604 TaxID=933084 RepID=A0A067QA45_9AGAM|nr:hypothetical protein JAAARDRAFT_32987 [Jaapia argillacea MUCL 33604]